MEARSAWTDERLNDRFDHIDGELGALRTEMGALRQETREGFALTNQRTDALGQELRAEIGTFRGEIKDEIGTLRSDMKGETGGLRGEIGGLRGEIGGLRGELTEFRLLMIRLYAAQTIALLGVIAAILARGA